MDRDPLVELPGELVRPTPRGPNAGEGGGARYVMGIDGGATKTLAAVLDLERGALHLGQGGPSNEDAVGTQRAVKALLQAADQAIARAGIASERLDAAVLAAGRHRYGGCGPALALPSAPRSGSWSTTWWRRGPRRRARSPVSG